MNTIINWYDKIYDNEVVEFLLNYPKKSNTGNYILDCIIDFSYFNIPYRDIYTIVKRLKNLEDALLEYYQDETRYEINIIKKIQITDRKIYLYLNPYLIIYYPKLTITNSDGLSINTYDTYVKFKMNNGINLGKLFYTFSLAKLHQSKIEVNNYYGHSHIRSYRQNSYEFDSFCLGTGYFATRQTDRETSKDTHIFDFHMLTQTLSWESIDGTPFKYIKNIQPYKVEYTDEKNKYKISNEFIIENIDTPLSNDYKEILKAIINLKDENTFKYLINNNGILSVEINFNQDIYDYLCEHKFKFHQLYKYFEGKYYLANYSTDDNDEIKIINTDFYFLGKNIPKIIEPVTKKNLNRFYNNLKENYDKLPTRPKPDQWQPIKKHIELYINKIISRKENPEKWENSDEGCFLAENEISMSKYSKW